MEKDTVSDVLAGEEDKKPTESLGEGSCLVPPKESGSREELEALAEILGVL